MLIPAWMIAILALLYALEYFQRVWFREEKRYIWFGKGIGRLIVAVTYAVFAVVPVDANTRAVWIRLSLLLFLCTDLFFIAQEHFMRLTMRKK